MNKIKFCLLGILKYSKPILHLTIAVSIAIALLHGLFFMKRVNRIADHADSAIQNLEKTSNAIADYAEVQKAALLDPKNQRALDATIQAGAVFNATGRLLNTQVVPHAMRSLDSLDLTLRNLAQNSASLNRFIVGLDQNINTGLLPASTALIANLNETARRFGVTVDELNQAIKLSSQQLNVTLQALQVIIGDPEWSSIIHNLNRTSESTADAMAAAPSIAASLEKIAKTSSKFSRITLIANIVSTLARAFLP